MSYAVLRETKQKARKAHRCFLCCEDIPVGMVYGRCCTVNDGRMLTTIYHLACAKVLYSLADPFDIEDGFAEGELRERLQYDPDVDLSFVKDESERKRLEAIAHEFDTGDEGEPWPLISKI